MVKFLLAAAVLAEECPRAPAATNSKACKDFQVFETKYKKEYSSDEERSKAFNTFEKNIDYVSNLYKKVEKTRDAIEIPKTFDMISPFADMDPSVFRQKMTGCFKKDAPIPEKISTFDRKNEEVPDAYDARKKGAVNPVKDQGMCGSCWAFATVANIEGVYFFQHKKLYSLSEQELVSCDGKDGGCEGGLPSQAAQWLIDHKLGLEEEDKYPYTASDDTCQVNEREEVVFVQAWMQVKQGDEVAMAEALVKYGPLSIGINASYLQFYFGGILDPEFFHLPCDPAGLDHGVTIVGYGTGDGWLYKKAPYWIIRNSWTSMWGEQGYFRIVRGKGSCGLDQMVTTVTETSGPPGTPKYEPLKEIVA